jgi:CheY-like chemotaxis protein
MNLKKAKVLLVDDNHYSLELILQILLGFRIQQTITCTSSVEARTVVESQNLDLIIADVEMPDEDGVALTEYVRSLTRLPNFTTPIILVAAHASIDAVTRARDAGANLVITKPVAPAILLSRIDWLARSNREFVRSENYRGPDRRFKNKPLPDGIEERRADMFALTAALDRKMSQDEVDSLFG